MNKKASPNENIFFRGTMKFLSMNSVDSIYTKGSGGEIFLGNIRE